MEVLHNEPLLPVLKLDAAASHGDLGIAKHWGQGLLADRVGCLVKVKRSATPPSPPPHHPHTHTHSQSLDRPLTYCTTRLNRYVTPSLQTPGIRGGMPGVTLLIYTFVERGDVAAHLVDLQDANGGDGEAQLCEHSDGVGGPGDALLLVG